MKQAGLILAIAISPAIAAASGGLTQNTAMTAPIASDEYIVGGSEKIVMVGSESGFVEWVRGFRQRALARGIEPDIFDSAFSGVNYDSSIIEKDRNQSEFVKPIWEYLDKAVSEKRVEN
ncbi:MAG: lytic murein transglycosylase, partial [Paracoccaceae bacterium]